MALVSFSDSVRKIKTTIIGRYCQKRDLQFTQGQVKEYAETIMTYLCIMCLTDAPIIGLPWQCGHDFVAHTFGRQAIPITWDFAEINLAIPRVKWAGSCLIGMTCGISQTH